MKNSITSSTADYFVDDLAEILEDNLPEDQAASALTLAQQCARNEEHAVDKVNEHSPRRTGARKLSERARDRKLKELMKITPA